MIAAYGVSKTVIREAVAALRSSGYVFTRHGVGTFVADFSRHRVFQIAGRRRRVDSRNRQHPAVPHRHRDRIGGPGGGIRDAGGSCRHRYGIAPLRGRRRLGQPGHRCRFSSTIAPSHGRPRIRCSCASWIFSAVWRFRVRAWARPLPCTTPQKRYLRKLQNEHRRIQQAIVEHRPVRARKAMRRSSLHQLGPLSKSARTAMTAPIRAVRRFDRRPPEQGKRK